MNTEEIWKEIPNTPGYQISSHGRIKSRIRIRKLCLLSKKYLALKIQIDTKRTGKTLIVHRLVAQHFVPNPDSKPQVNHKDGNKQNNHMDNLEWCTASENTQHAYKLGLLFTPRGEQQKTSKYKEEDILKIKKLLAEGVRVNEVGRRFGIKGSYISLIRRGKRWAHVQLPGADK